VAKRKPGPGRPSLGDKGKSSSVTIRLSAETREQWAAAAARAGVSVGEWLRAAAEAEIDRGNVSPLTPHSA
jgi:predicted HicB family RNase H-like nuclease